MNGEAHPLQGYRKRVGLSLDDLARMAHTTKATLSRIENRKQVPGLDLVGRLKEATGGQVSADDFLPPEAAECQP